MIWLLFNYVAVALNLFIFIVKYYFGSKVNKPIHFKDDFQSHILTFKMFLINIETNCFHTLLILLPWIKSHIKQVTFILKTT